MSEAIDTRPPPPSKAFRASTATWRLAVLLVVFAGIGLVLANSLRVYFAQAQEIAEVKAEIAAREDEIADLQDKLKRWEDPDYVRSVARVRLGWVMPGEVGYRVIGADGLPLDGATMSSSEHLEPTGEWWEKMWGSVALADSPPPPPEVPANEPLPERTIQPPSPSPTP